jgi:hypothetical protein
MDDKNREFEASRSFGYRFVRYTVLPEVVNEVSSRGNDPFLLREVAWPIIDRYLTKEQQALRIPKAKAAGDDSMGSIVRFYVSFLTKELNLFVPIGKGYYRPYSEEDISEDELVDAAIEEGDEDAAETGGWIYAFSFPLILKKDQPFPIKIGKTVGDVEARVTDQVKGSASFEQPTVLGRWQAKRVGPTELAIHNVLKARGKWRENAPGKEWFDTTLTEIEAIIRFVCSDAPN